MFKIENIVNSYKNGDYKTLLKILDYDTVIFIKNNMENPLLSNEYKDILKKVVKYYNSQFICKPYEISKSMDFYNNIPNLNYKEISKTEFEKYVDSLSLSPYDVFKFYRVLLKVLNEYQKITLNELIDNYFFDKYDWISIIYNILKDRDNYMDFLFKNNKRVINYPKAFLTNTMVDLKVLEKEKIDKYIMDYNDYFDKKTDEINRIKAEEDVGVFFKNTINIYSNNKSLNDVFAYYEKEYTSKDLFIYWSKLKNVLKNKQSLAIKQILNKYFKNQSDKYAIIYNILNNREKCMPIFVKNNVKKIVIPKSLLYYLTEEEKSLIDDFSKKYVKYYAKNYKLIKRQEAKNKALVLFEKIKKEYLEHKDINKIIESLNIEPHQLWQFQLFLKKELAATEDIEFLNLLVSNSLKELNSTAAIIYLILNNSIEDAIKTLIDNHLGSYKLSGFIANTRNASYCLTEAQLQYINDFYDAYKKYIAEKQLTDKEEKYDLLVNEANNLFESIINNKISNIEEYLISLNINEMHFNRLLRALKENNNDLYQIYNRNTQDYKKKISSQNVDNIRESIINKIINGIVLDNGTCREFDIFDYYRTTNLSFDDLYFVLKGSLDYEERKALGTFVGKYTDEKILYNQDIENICNSTYTYNVVKDDYDNIISSKVIGLDEHKYLFDLLKTNDIPITFNTYKLALKRFINNEEIIKPFSINKKLYLIKK
ncbi:MAG: hypothetical protein IJ574_00100 [Bacilli bacterium]|nr:hypothetical protein [Bacilli bacterium]